MFEILKVNSSRLEPKFSWSTDTFNIGLNGIFRITATSILPVG